MIRSLVLLSALWSVAAVAQTFTDVPEGYWAGPYIEILAANGITSGCGGGNYCPEAPVTRAEMAVFLERGMNGGSFSPPPASGNVFLDVGAGDFAAAWIERLYADGITAGCGNNRYCPNSVVTRDQMAVLLLRVKHGAGYRPPAAVGIFADVDLAHWAVHWIEALAAEGITAGCGNGNYCPDASVTRAQVAVFLVRVFGLVMPPSEELPDDPVDVAPDIDTSVATSMHQISEFLYTGNNPIQTGVTDSTMNPERVAVLRGQVRKRDGSALSGVVISISGHDEFGQTLTRSDGLFDLAVNGGGQLTVNYRRDNYLPVQRTIDVPWQEYAWLDDVVMIPLDSNVTNVPLNSGSMHVARGSQVTDIDGERQATVLIPPATGAEVILANGTTQSVSSLDIHITEYTIGRDGPNTMPGPLPPTSGYTYAIELTAEQAINKVAGKDVLFNQPVFVYVEDFIGFPVGSAVPSGYYNADSHQWIASNNGRVIEVLDIIGGLAELDTDGDGLADNQTVMLALGITDAERQQLSSLYNAGQSLWRVPVTHFSTRDFNWPIAGPQSGSEPPNQGNPDTENTETKPECFRGSIIECQNQVLRETIAVTGTPFTLNYRSDRVPGRKAAYSLSIPVTGDIVPIGLESIELDIQIAGQRVTEVFQPTPNISYDFTWDGMNAYGITLQGIWQASIALKYIYPTSYYPAGINVDPSFAAMGPQTEMILSRDATEAGIVQRWEMDMGVFDARAIGLGSWSLSPHHVYFPSQSTLFLGGGEIRKVDDVGLVSRVFAGSFTEGVGLPRTGYCGDGMPATESCLRLPHDIEVAPDGSVYIADWANHRIRRVDTLGIISTIAGTGVDGLSGDGGLATSAELSFPRDLTIAADGSLYVVDSGNNRIRRIDNSGVITTVAGGGGSPYSDGALAVDIDLNNLQSLAVTPDNSLYIGGFGYIFRVDPEGFISVIAGTGNLGYNGDDLAATDASISTPSGIVLDLDGGIIFTDFDNIRVRRIDPSGIITTIAGNGTTSYQGDGSLATETGLELPNSLAVDSDGSLYLTVRGGSTRDGRVRRIDQNGRITTVAGSPWVCCDYVQQYMPATSVSFYSPTGIALHPDGSILVSEDSNGLVRRLSAPLESTSSTDNIISSEDGNELYVFDQDGRHLRTLHPLTAATFYEFGYDSNGLLQTVTDGDGNVTTIEHDFAGNPTAIVSPYNQRTALSVDAAGYVSFVTNPANEATQIAYSGQGLLTGITDAKLNTSLYQYDNSGRLVRAEDPAGGSKTLARNLVQNGYEVTLTTALGRSTSFRVENLPTGEKRRLVTYPDGTQQESIRTSDGTRTTTYPDGSVEIIKLGPDPRWGMTAPVMASMELRSNSAGITKTMTESRNATLLDPADLMSVSLFERTIEVNGRVTTSTYDASTGQVSIRTPEARRAVIDLDQLGRATLVEITGLDATSLNYDLRGRLDALVAGSGVDARTTAISYGVDGFMSSVVDPLGQQLGIAHDPAGRVTSLTRPDTQSMGFDYDANGNLVSLTPPGRPAHEFSYTPVDLQDFYYPPDVNAGADATNFGYNVDRQLDSITGPDNRAVIRTFDPSGRSATVNIPRGTIGLGYNDVNGQLVQVTAPDNGTLNYGYSGPFLTSEGWTGFVSGSVEFAYDNDFRVSSIGINGTDVINKVYDNDGLIVQSGGLGLTRHFQHGLVSATSIGAISDARTFNPFAELETYSASFNATALFNVQFTRDKLGRIDSKTETVDGTTDVYEYSYDTAGRLEQVRQNSVVTDIYSYDANGNRLAHNGINGSYDDQDRLVSYGATTYGYTANGELLSKSNAGQTTSYDYDVLGNLTQVTLADGMTINYVIDGTNRRIGKRINNTLVQGFLYKDQLNPVAELDGNNNVVARFVYASKDHVPDYMIKNGNTYRIISDHSGSVRLVVNVTDGSVAQRMDYDAFGLVTNDTNPGFQPFGFAGGLYDSLTDLTRFGARDYDASIGRWIAKDPILFAGDDTNLYAYVRSDPINLIDPHGRQAIECPGKKSELDWWKEILKAAWHNKWELTKQIVTSFGGEMLAETGSANAGAAKLAKDSMKLINNLEARNEQLRVGWGDRVGVHGAPYGNK